MITHRKISAVDEMAVAAAEALKQEKVLAKAMKKGGKPSYPGNINLNLSTKDVKESKDKCDLKGVKISDSDELHHIMEGPVPVPALSLALRTASTAGDDAASATAYATKAPTGEASSDKMNINNTDNHTDHRSAADCTAGSSVTHSDSMSLHDRDTRTASSSLVPGLGLGLRPSAVAVKVSVEDMVTGPGLECTASGCGDGLTPPVAPHAQDMTSTSTLTVTEKRSGRVRVPKRMFEENSSMQNSEESIPTLDCADDVTIPRGGVDGVKSVGSLLVELDEPEDEEERAGLCVVLPSELTPNPDPSSFLPCMAYSLPCEDAFYACCMDQVSAVMSCHVMSCHVMSCHVMSCHVTSCHVMLCDDIFCLVTSGLSSNSTLVMTHTHALYLSVSFSLITHTHTYCLLLSLCLSLTQKNTHTLTLTASSLPPSA